MIRLIKRYGGGSRKLYDTEESRYISLQEIPGWIRRGQRLRVVDSRTGEDVTAQTLAQVISAGERRGGSLLSSDLLQELIRRGTKSLKTRVGQLQGGMTRIVRESAGRLAPVREAREEMEVLRRGLRDLQRSVALLERESPATGSVRRGRRRHAVPQRQRRIFGE